MAWPMMSPLSLSLSASGLNYDLYKFRLISGVYQVESKLICPLEEHSVVMWLSSLALFFCIFSLRPAQAVSGSLQPRPTGTSQCSVTVTTVHDSDHWGCLPARRRAGTVPVTVTAQPECGGTATAARAPAAGRPGGHCQCTTVLNQGDQGGSLMIPPSLP